MSNKTAVIDEDPSIYWNKQRSGTDALAAALRSTGVPEGIVTTPGTTAPAAVNRPGTFVFGASPIETL